MNRLIIALTLAIASASLPVAVPAQARDLKTMHFENDLPRPAGVAISGAQPDQVVLYCTDSAACKGLRDHLRKTGIAFLDKYPKNDPEAGAEFDALGGQGVPLVVFKHRLMHGYYPNSFDRLYAQYHSGATPGRTPQPAPPETAVAQSARPPARPGAALQVEDIAPADLAAYIQTHPNVVVQFTSPDRGCGFCVDGSFEAFDASAAAASGNIRFARVQWSPWNNFPKEIERIIGGSVPIHINFKSGQAKGRYAGTIGSSANQEKFQRWLERLARAGP